MCSRELGKGATGSVYKAERNGELAAIKILEKHGNENYVRLHQNMINEISALERVGNHPYILQIVGYGLDVQWEQDGDSKQGDYIATEVVPHGELFDYVANPRGCLSEAVAKQVFL